MTPDADTTRDPDPDVDTNIPLGLVPDTTVLDDADHAVRAAVTWVEDELERLRRQRVERDRTGLAEVAELRRRLIEDRTATNARIKVLVAEQARLARVLRALDQ